ncbi:MAG: DUF1501 domain-containing protein [Planctomycetota bacterium]|nr:DUF1501 domain-containing protein [Planctomycetota bacterium]
MGRHIVLHHREETMSQDRGKSGPDQIDRRDFLAGAAAVGVTAAIPPPLRGAAAPLARAQAVIQIYLGGGLSHIDSFDPKPDAPVDTRGPFRSIATKIDDVRFSELCRNLAKVADKLSVIRSMTHTEAAHERGRHNMLTGYRPSPAIVYPSFGAVVSHELGVRNDLPPYVCVPNATNADFGTGYLSSAFGSFSVGGEPARSGFSVKDLGPTEKLGDARKARRRKMLAELDAGYAGQADGISATQEFYRQAWDLIDSPKAQEAFKIEKESKQTRDRYGRTTIGQRLLLARRLVGAGVRFVAVPSGGWDHHNGISTNLRRSLPPVDQAVAALIADLDERGMLDNTMVVLSTEFGRTPRINRIQGRDHWPRVFSMVAAGGGIKRGYVHGSSDPGGSEPQQLPVSPADFAATMFTQLGIDPHKRLMSPGDRPIDIVRGGAVIRELLS